MRPMPLHLLLTIALILPGTWAQAAVFCTASSPGFASGYVPTNLTTNITSTTFTVTCNKNSIGAGSSTVTYQVAVNNGLNFVGAQNRASKAGSFINYSVTTDIGCATLWKGVTVLPIPAASFVMTKNTIVANTYTYYGCIPPGQLALPPEGIYTDTVTMTFTGGSGASGGGSTFTGGTFPVNIIAPASCNLTTPPANLAFTYTAFSPAPVLANASYGITCTTSLAYTMALDLVVDVVTGLNYSLGLNTVATGGVNPLASVGTGIAQTFFINGTMAAGQAGTCATASCAGSQVRTLTITY